MLLFYRAWERLRLAEQDKKIKNRRRIRQYEPMDSTKHAKMLTPTTRVVTVLEPEQWGRSNVDGENGALLGVEIFPSFILYKTTLDYVHVHKGI